MKRLMLTLIYLLVITPFCRAADVPDDKGKGKEKIEEEIENLESWYQAVADIPNWQQAENLYLSGMGITNIPKNLNLPNLMRLDLSENHIEYIDPEILEGLPNLRLLVLNKNPLTQENIKELEEKAEDVGLRDRAGCLELSILARNLKESPYSGSIKPAKR